jgi:hypothetical protein
MRGSIRKGILLSIHFLTNEKQLKLNPTRRPNDACSTHITQGESHTEQKLQNKRKAGYIYRHDRILHAMHMHLAAASTNSTINVCIA